MTNITQKRIKIKKGASKTKRFVLKTNIYKTTTKNQWRGATKNIPVMPVANNPRYLVIGKRCVTLVLSKSLSCIENPKVSILDTNTHTSKTKNHFFSTHRNLLLSNDTNWILSSDTNRGDSCSLHSLESILCFIMHKNSTTQNTTA